MLRSFLDDIEPIDWKDFERAACLTKDIVRKLAGDKELLRDLVYQVESDPRLLSMSERIQPLDKIVIYDALERGFRIRLHLWANESYDRPHNHRFSFTSIILRGHYTHTWYRANQEVSDSFDTTLVEPLYITDEAEGSCYTLHHTAIHTAFPAPDTISLILRGPAEKKRSIITERGTGKVWWRAGTQDETAERRRQVQLSLDDYKSLCIRLTNLSVI